MYQGDGGLCICVQRRKSRAEMISLEHDCPASLLWPWILLARRRHIATTSRFHRPSLLLFDLLLRFRPHFFLFLLRLRFLVLSLLLSSLLFLLFFLFLRWFLLSVNVRIWPQWQKKRLFPERRNLLALSLRRLFMPHFSILRSRLSSNPYIENPT